MIRRPPRSTQSRSSAASDVYKRQNLSFKISGSHFSANEWPYISEEEYKSHRNPWVGFPGRQIDGRDNNASVTGHTGGLSPATESRLRWVQTINQGIQVNKGNVFLSLNGWNLSLIHI